MIYIRLGGNILNFVGIDIGSTASKVAVRGDKNLEFAMPTGWNSKETAGLIKEKLKEKHDVDIDSDDTFVTATGYGRISVDYADEVITEITCHAKGATEISGYDNCTVIDIGGQDTKVISIVGGVVDDFIMNDKCSAGTGRFIEIMADRMGISLGELFEYASRGKSLKISSMCTVFAESEIISLMGEGEDREDIASGIVDSVVTKALQLASRFDTKGNVVLTGGLAQNDYFVRRLEEEIGNKIFTDEHSRFAGAIGACAIGKQKYKRLNR